MREASEHPTDLDPKYEDLHLRILLAQSTLTDEQSRLDKLRAQAAAAKPDEKERLQDQMDLIEAQQALDEDELEDARQDLIREGGNPEGMMQRLRAEHEAGHNEAAAAPAPSQSAPDLNTGNLYGQVPTRPARPACQRDRRRRQGRHLHGRQGRRQIDDRKRADPRRPWIAHR